MPLMLRKSAEAWSASQFKLKGRHIPLKCLAEGRGVRRCSEFKLVAAIQIDIAHATIVAQKDLKVDLQAWVCLHHGGDPGKVPLDPLAQLGLVWRVCDEALGAPDKAVRFEVYAPQNDACGPRTRANRLHGMRPGRVISWSGIVCSSWAGHWPVRAVKQIDSALQLEVQVPRLLGRQGCDLRRSREHMAHSEALLQTFGKRPGSAPLRKRRRRGRRPIVAPKTLVEVEFT